MAENKQNLYQCTALFCEAMHERFPNGCPDGSAVMLIATNGKKMTSIIEGSNDKLTELIANITYGDKELMEIFTTGMAHSLHRSMMDKYKELYKDNDGSGTCK